MTKHLTIRLENGEVWAFPADVVAKSRASYYAGKDPDTTYEEEYEYTLSNVYELEDWACNNMSWSDVRPWAKKLSDAMVSDDDMFMEAWSRGFELINIPDGVDA